MVIFPFVCARKGNATESVVFVGVHILYIPQCQNQYWDGLIITYSVLSHKENKNYIYQYNIQILAMEIRKR